VSEVTLDQVTKSYGASRVVDDFSFAVRQGELVALLGPSGCGKTTTLRMVAGFTPVTSGRIRFDARDVTDLPPYRRNTGMVFQGYALFPHLTVFENISFGLEMRHLPHARIQEMVQRALETVRLGELGDRLPRQLSGGQQQRVALARALVIEPDVLLLDEPLSNLDAKLRAEVRVEIRHIQQRLGLTTIFVTHDQEEALSLADRLVVMNKGRIEQVGTPEELYEAPRTRFVASFIGRVNFITGRIVDDNRFCSTNGDIYRFARRGVDSDAPVLAIRPEKVTMGRDANPAIANHAAATVESFSYLGPVVEYGLRLRSGDLMIVHRQNRDNVAEARFGLGETVFAQWSEDAALVL
jgi:putative spermidine/putrescine transport system ATP-binding protein